MSARTRYIRRVRSAQRAWTRATTARRAYARRVLAQLLAEDIALEMALRGEAWIDTRTGRLVKRTTGVTGCLLCGRDPTAPDHEQKCAEKIAAWQPTGLVR